MKITLTIEGLPAVPFETWRAGGLSHTKGRPPVDPVRLELEHGDAGVILEQLEAFVLSSLASEGARLEFPSTSSALTQRDGLTSTLGETTKELDEARRARDRAIARAEDESQRHRLWFKRAVEAADLVLSLRERLAGRGIRWPKGFRERASKVAEWSAGDEKP